MRRSVRLVVLGFLLLGTAFALPVVDLFTAEWDTDYRYRVPTEGFCADAVAELRADTSSDAETFVVDRATLSAAALANVRRAERDGSYTVEREAAAAGPFRFTSDHVARGTGCYAIRDAERGRYRALVTERVTHRTDTTQERAVRTTSPVAAALGGLSLLGGVVLSLRRRLH